MRRLSILPALCVACMVSGTASAQPTCNERYVVKPGDTLSKIAKSAYRDASLWRYIYDYSSNARAIGGRPGLMSAGTVLKLPPCPEASEVTTETFRRIAGGLRSILVAEAESPVMEDGVSTSEGLQREASNGDQGQAEAGGPLIPLLSEGESSSPELKTRGPGANDEEAVPEKTIQKIAALENPPTTPLSLAEDKRIPGQSASTRLSITAEPASETDQTLVFELALSEPAPRSIAIIYTLLNGSATATMDYQHRQGVVVFKTGEQQATLVIDIVDDDIVEETETFKLFITGDPSAVSIETRTAEASIHDNDA